MELRNKWQILNDVSPVSTNEFRRNKLSINGYNLTLAEPPRWPKETGKINQSTSTKSNKSTPPQISTDNTVIQSRYVSLCAGTKKIGLKSKGWNWGHNWAGPSCAILPGENRQKDQKGEDWWSVETRWDVFAVFASHFWCWDFFFLCKLALFRWNLELLLFL